MENGYPVSVDVVPSAALHCVAHIIGKGAGCDPINLQKIYLLPCSTRVEIFMTSKVFALIRQDVETINTLTLVT